MPTTMFTTAIVAHGTPVPITKNATPAVPAISGSLSGQASLRASSIVFQAHPANTASHYIYIGGPAMSVSGKTGIGLALSPGATQAAVYPNGDVAVDDFWFDTDASANGDVLMVTVSG